MRCLLGAEALHSAGLTPIPHWASKPAAVWGQLLKGVRPRAPRLALRPPGGALAPGVAAVAPAPVPMHHVPGMVTHRGAFRITHLAITKKTPFRRIQGVVPIPRQER